MPLNQLSAALTRDQAYALVDAVSAREDLALTATAFEDEASGEWVFEATCDTAPDLDAFSLIARETLGGNVDFAVETLDPGFDWVTESLRGLAPVQAARFYIHGSHDTATPPAGSLPILIDAAQAFGTGHHETTTGCLEAIELVARRARPTRIIDVGTGTGVLAIAAAKRLKQPVLATDIDPISVRVAAENALLNGVGPLLRAVEATGMDHRSIRDGAPYDMIIANILAGPLVALAPAIARAAAPGGFVILSGLLKTQATKVINAYRAQGLVPEKTLIRKDWATLILRRSPARFHLVRYR